MKKSLFTILLFLCFSATSYADLLEDRNGDGEIRALAFGDSITAGVGDGALPGDFVESASFDSSLPGYPGRLEDMLGVPVRNAGVPGELVSEDGVSRIASSLIGSRADVLFLLEGSNDAVFQVDPAEIKRSYQKIINIARTLDREVVLITLPLTCCDRSGFTFLPQSIVRKCEN